MICIELITIVVCFIICSSLNDFSTAHHNCFNVVCVCTYVCHLDFSSLILCVSSIRLRTSCGHFRPRISPLLTLPYLEWLIAPVLHNNQTLIAFIHLFSCFVPIFNDDNDVLA